jgi:hypothetical protein
MSNPFSGIPDPGTPPFKRRVQPTGVQEALRALRDTLRPALQVAARALRQAQKVAKDALWRAQPVAQVAIRRARWYGEDLRLHVRRNPRAFGIIGGAVALTLVGAFALNASGAGRSLCPATSDKKTPQFRLLMDRVPQLAAGSEVEIHYDVCGLRSGTPYSGRVRLTRQLKAAKKGAPKPKPLVVSFKDEVDGVATRRHQDLNLGSTKPGAYILELSVSDSWGRERTKVQKVLVKAR